MFQSSKREAQPGLPSTESSPALEWHHLSYFLYSVLLAAGMIVTLPYWLYQIARHGKYHAGLAERMGGVPARLAGGGPKRVIWVHAVSLGEVQAVAGLVEEMQRRFTDHRVVVSTTTDTGQALARKRFGEENVFYFPLDFALPFVHIFGHCSRS